MSVLVNTISRLRAKQDNSDFSSMKHFITTNFPTTVEALCQIDEENIRPKRRKGFNFVIRESKKHGQRIYARFSYNDVKIPTKFNTFTDNEKDAELYVQKNKARLIEGYLARKDGRMYKMFESFYESKQDNLIEKSRLEYDKIIKKKFIPFLKQEKINEYGKLTKSVLIKFQDMLLKKGLKPQSVNNNVKALKNIFVKLTRQNIYENNPYYLVKGLPVREKDRKIRGCYDLEKINGIFNKKWKDELSYLLCSLIYTTGMRNSEIKRIKLKDIQLINGCRFIKIEESKTANGKRLIPLHKALYEKIKMWGMKNKLGEKPLFDVHNDKFNRANNELARRLKVSDEELKGENITFYSGRHFWKTLMSAEGLGEDIEEIWMGHKVSGNVAKLYNHRDKQGNDRLTQKAQQMFSILDRCVFKTEP